MSPRVLSDIPPSACLSGATGPVPSKAEDALPAQLKRSLKAIPPSLFARKKSLRSRKYLRNTEQDALPF